MMVRKVERWRVVRIVLVESFLKGARPCFSEPENALQTVTSTLQGLCFGHFTIFAARRIDAEKPVSPKGQQEHFVQACSLLLVAKLVRFGYDWVILIK